MNMCRQEVIKLLFSYLNLPPVEIQELASSIILDCGVDAGNLTPDDIIAVLEGNYEGNWQRVAFAIDEVLAIYSCEKLSDEQFVRSVLASLILAEATRHGVGDLWLSFNKIFEIIFDNRTKIDSDIAFLFFVDLLKGVCEMDLFCGNKKDDA